MRSTERAMRPFWLHQSAEYLIGVALIAQGLQGPEPLVPALAGGLVMVNAAVTIGPLGAFRLVGRRLHRVLDVVVMALIVLAAVQPWVSVDAGSRLIMGFIVVVLGFVWFYTDFAERDRRRQRRLDRTGDRSDEIGRSAGRYAGNAVRGFKRRSEQQ